MPWPPRQPRREEIALTELSEYAMVCMRHLRYEDDPEENGAHWFGQLLLSPKMAYHISDMGQVVRAAADRPESGEPGVSKAKTFTHREREWADQVLMARFGINIVQFHHLGDAIALGCRVEAIEALRRHGGFVSDELNADEAQLTDFVNRVYDGEMTKEIWEAMEERMGERGALEYAVLVCHLQTVFRLMQAIGREDIPDETVEQWLQEYKDGTRNPTPMEVVHARNVSGFQREIDLNAFDEAEGTQPTGLVQT